MQRQLHAIAIATLLAASSLASHAQPAAGPGMGMHGSMDHSKVAAMMEKHTTALKAKLKLSPEQEGAWTTFVAAMKPDMGAMDKNRPDREAMNKLTTPERIDAMRAQRKQRMADMSAAMDKRDEATKTFYAALSAEQKKTFDAEHQRMGQQMHERMERRQPGGGERPAKP